jgi:hypothetical protein
MGRIRLIPDPIDTTPEGTHPGFRLGPSTTLRHHNGFGFGAHYTLEIDENDQRRMIVEPAEGTVVWYFAEDSVEGFTAEEIAATTSGAFSAGQITPTWLRGGNNTGGYGLRSDRPLAWEVAGVAAIGRQVYETIENFVSEWAMFRRGGVYRSQRLRMGVGESPLHPAVHGAFGTGARPVWSRGSTQSNNNKRDNRAFIGIDFRTVFTYNSFSSDILYADCNFTCSPDALSSDGSTLTRLTLYGSSIIDCKEITPIAGGGVPATSWAATNANRSSGTFMSEIDSLLRWRTLWDRNGWDPTYNIDGVTWNNGQFGQPPSEYNHHNYDSRELQDVTTRESVYARAPFDAINGRCSVHLNLVVELDSPHGIFFGDGQITFGAFTDATGTFPSGGRVIGLTSGKSYNVSSGGSTTFKIESRTPGEYFDPGERIRFLNNGTEATWISYATHRLDIEGNTPYANRLLRLGYSELEVFHGDKGNRGGVISGVDGDGNGGTFKNIIAANAVDPQHANFELNNPDLRFRKNPTGRAFDNNNAQMNDARFVNAYRYDNITVWNWGNQANDKNRPNLPTTTLNRVTIGRWADDEQSVAPSTNNADTAIDYIRTRSDRCLLATDIWNYAQTVLGRPTIGHAPGAMARFSPDPDGNGWRTDSPDAWLINGVRGDFPVDGDDCDLDAQLAHSYDTWRFADMDFGAGGGWLLYGGYISCETTQGNGTLDLRGAGQFWLTTSSVDINVTASGGRLGIAGTVSQVRGTFSERAELLIIPGGALTISTGDTVTLNGSLVKAGADGQSGTASLTVQGTLAFVASGGQMPRVREFRSGKYGLAVPTAGHTGQPREPNLTFNVTLASGSTISVDATGLPNGNYDIIVADSLTNSGATLTTNRGTLTVVGNVLRLTVT